MTSTFVSMSTNQFVPSVNRSVFSEIFDQYRRVIIESIITSFALDFLITDQHGGDVDTIHNVRAIDHDDRMHYKNAANEANYANRGNYNSNEYHSDSRYINKNREIKQQKDQGTLRDAYTAKRSPRIKKVTWIMSYLQMKSTMTAEEC